MTDTPIPQEVVERVYWTANHQLANAAGSNEIDPTEIDAIVMTRALLETLCADPAFRDYARREWRMIPIECGGCGGDLFECYQSAAITKKCCPDCEHSYSVRSSSTSEAVTCEDCRNEDEAILTGYSESSSGWGFGTYECKTEGCRNYPAEAQQQ